MYLLIYTDGLEPIQAGLAIWLDASDQSTLSLDNSRVTQWRDKSGNLNHASQAVTIRQPLLIQGAVNTLPSLRGRHDGTNSSQMSIPDAPSLKYTQFTQFCVARRNSISGGTEHVVGKFRGDAPVAIEQRLVIQGGGLERLLQNGDADGALGGDVNAVSPTNSTGAINTTYICEGQYSGTTLSVRVNGSGPNTATLASVFNGTSPVFLFSRDVTFSEGLRGDICEYLFYTRALSTTERNLVYTYLATKWGV